MPAYALVGRALKEAVEAVDSRRFTAAVTVVAGDGEALVTTTAGAATEELNDTGYVEALVFIELLLKSNSINDKKLTLGQTRL